jgi:hypothetical protein
LFNGSVWQRVEGGANGNFSTLSVSGLSSLNGGVNVTGSVTADGITVDGNILLSNEGNELQFNTSSTPVNKIYSDDTYTSNGLTISAENGVALQSTNNYLVLDDTGTNEMVLNVDGGERMRVTSTGIDVTGTVTADGLTVDGTSNLNGVAQIGGSTNLLYLSGKTGTHAYVSLGGSSTAADFFIGADTAIPLIFRTNATERMRIDASGHLLVGKTATGLTAGFEVQSSGQITASQANAPAAKFNRLTNDGEIIRLHKDGTTVGSIGSRSGVVSTIILDPRAGGMGITGGGVRLTPTDNTGTEQDARNDIGTSTYRFKDLHLSGSAYAGSLFVNVTTEVAAGYIASIKCAAGTGGVIIQNSNTTGVPLSFRDTSGGGIGSVSTTNTATAYNTSSDQRLKDNIVDAPSASDDIDAIQVRSFDWKADGSHQKYGMVAQELQTVAPEAVSAPEDPEEMMGVDYSKLVPMMLKEIQSLRARIAALES